MTGHEAETTVPSARVSTDAVKAQLAKALEPATTAMMKRFGEALEPLNAAMAKQIDDALRPLNAAMAKQIDDALQPLNAAMMKRFGEALEPSTAAMMKQIDDALRPWNAAMAKQIDDALQPLNAAMMKRVIEAVEPSVVGLAGARSSFDSRAGWDLGSARTVARLLEDIQDPALASISESSARLAKEMIADGSHARLLIPSEVDEQSPSEHSTSTAINGESQEIDDRGRLLGMRPDQYFAATVTTVLVLLWVYVYICEMIRLDQGVGNLNRASLIMELIGVAAAVKDVYGRSLQAAQYVDNKGSGDDDASG